MSKVMKLFASLALVASLFAFTPSNVEARWAGGWYGGGWRGGGWDWRGGWDGWRGGGWGWGPAFAVGFAPAFAWGVGPGWGWGPTWLGQPLYVCRWPALRLGACSTLAFRPSGRALCLALLVILQTPGR
jgi:hypothetical protein